MLLKAIKDKKTDLSEISNKLFQTGNEVKNRVRNEGKKQFICKKGAAIF